MALLLEYFDDHWLALGLLVLSLIWWMGPLVLGRQHSWWWFPGILGPIALALFALGGLLDMESSWLSGWEVAGVVALVVIVLLGLAFFLVLITGQWFAPAGYFLGGLLCASLGGFLGHFLQPGIKSAFAFLVSLRPLEPWWLVSLLVIPAIIYLSFQGLAGLGPWRRVLVMGARCLLILFVVMALAEFHAQKPSENLTVLFLWDRSFSIPQEFDPKRPEVGDLREQRHLDFINEAVRLRGSRKQNDLAGVVVFGRSPRVELPPPEKGVREFRLKKIASMIDATHTDIGAAIKLALAIFPGGTGKRIVLISDGNENLGQAEEQARIAKQNGVEIDIVPVAAGRRNVNEVLVDRVEAPPATEKDARLPLRIVLRSFHPQIVVGDLAITKISLDIKKVGDRERPTFEAVPVLVVPGLKLTQGLNVFFFQQPGSKKEEAYTYEAKFVPRGVMDERGNLVHVDLPGDRIENNRASATVMARGQQSLLLLENTPGEHKLLVDRLAKARPGLKIVATDPQGLPPDPADLAVILSKFDCVVLANIPADSLTEDQQKVIRSNTHDQGCGLIMIGGNQSFGAGGWQGTEIEKALPVQCDLKTTKVEGKSGLVLMMHASEMAEGNAWQRKIAKLAIEKLSPADMVGMLYWDWEGKKGNGHTWHIPFAVIGDRRRALAQMVDTMNPGDMPDVDPAFSMALAELTKPAYNLSIKHIIFISDGDHWDASRAIINQLRAAKVSVTTVCITTHGQAEIIKMKALADACAQIDAEGKRRGNAYHIKNPNELPAIYIKESRLISQSFVHEVKFTPELKGRSGPTEGFKDLEPLHGYVRTTPRASALVEVPIETPVFKDKNKFPVLATWQYGLGKAVAFTSDARTILGPGGKGGWDRDWAEGTTHGKFWEQTVDWVMRPSESGKFLHLTTDHRDGKIRIVVDARDADKKPLTEVDFKAGISSPSFKENDGRKELRFEQKNAGVYEAIIAAEEVGAYFINLQAAWKDTKTGQAMTDGIRSGVTIPYSPEFAEMESNPALLEKLRDITGGKAYIDETNLLAEVAKTGEVFRPAIGQYSLQPLWNWLILLAGVCLLVDVALRRISLSPVAGWHAAVDLWHHLRGQEAVARPGDFMERLRGRKTEVDALLGGRRFDSTSGLANDLPDAAALSGQSDPAPTTRPQTPNLAPKAETEPQDFASRLLRAKKKALDERDKDRPK